MDVDQRNRMWAAWQCGVMVEHFSRRGMASASWLRMRSLRGIIAECPTEWDRRIVVHAFGAGANGMLPAVES